MEPIQSRFVVRNPAPAEAEDHANGEPAERPLITSQSVFSRRAAIGGGLAGLAGLGGLLMFPGQLLAAQAPPSNPFIVLIKGLYKPAVNPPNLRLPSINLNDGSYSFARLYPQVGVPGHTDQSTAIGKFFVQFAGDLCAYNLPQGSMAMRFKKGPDGKPEPLAPLPDGNGGTWLLGNLNLTILEGTGIYRSFAGGQNLMVDILHALADGTSYVEHCTCIISRP